MNRETVLDNEFITMWCYPDKGIIHHQVHKYVFGEVWKEALETGLQKLVEIGGTKWLSDDRNSSALPAEEADWGKNVWAPKAFAAGLRHWVIVMPSKMAGQMFSQRVADGAEKEGFNFKTFEDLDEAMAWLEQV